MKEFYARCASILLDLRVIVGVCGALLSIVAHELFHVVTHWGDIERISMLPDSQAIVEVIFRPTGDYDIVFEEAVAYLITMVVLVLTVMLIYEINDSRNTKTVSQMIGGTRIDDDDLGFNEPGAMDHLAALLGVVPGKAELRDNR